MGRVLCFFGDRKHCWYSIGRAQDLQVLNRVSPLTITFESAVGNRACALVMTVIPSDTP